jgi:hypothetical protein
MQNQKEKLVHKSIQNIKKKKRKSIFNELNDDG